MSGIIDELRREHEDLMEVLMRVKMLDVRSHDGQRVFMTAKEKLLAHLRREDEEVYPLLQKAAEKDEEIRKLLDILSKEMKEVTKLASDFFLKFEGLDLQKLVKPSLGERLRGLVGSDRDKDVHEEFLRDFEALYGTLLDRIHKEENTLYRAFEEIEAAAKD